MTTLLSILALGFVLGIRHATDPDHVVAVTTIVAGQRSVRGAALIGAAWGLGHTLTILLVGSGIIIFKWVIPPRVGLGMELSVAIMLIVLGLANLAGTVRWLRARRLLSGRSARIHSHVHRHGDYVHTHPHGHDPEAHPHAEHATPIARLDGWLDATGGGPYRLVRPLAVQTPMASVLYLLIFGLGTIAGMILITAAIGVPFALGRTDMDRLQRGLRVASGLISVAFGIAVAYQVGVVDGLFMRTPHWTPR